MREREIFVVFSVAAVAVMIFAMIYTINQPCGSSGPVHEESAEVPSRVVKSVSAEVPVEFVRYRRPVIVSDRARAFMLERYDRLLVGFPDPGESFEFNFSNPVDEALLERLFEILVEDAGMDATFVRADGSVIGAHLGERSGTLVKHPFGEVEVFEVSVPK